MLLQHTFLRLAAILLFTLPAFAWNEGASSHPEWFQLHDGVAYFSAGDRIWATDGTPGGTRQYVPALASSTFVRHDLPVLYRGELYYFDQSYPPRLYAIGIPHAGAPRKIGELPLASPVASAVVLRDQLLFITFPYLDEGGTLWRSDGSTITRVADVRGWFEDELVVAGSYAYFSVYIEDRDQYELWRTDGTAEGTLLVDGDESLPSSLNATPLGDLLLYRGSGALMRTDGTPEGTYALAETSTFTVGNGAVWFTRDAALWKSDGTLEGTTRIGDAPEAEVAFDATGRIFLFEVHSDDVHVSLFENGAQGARVSIPISYFDRRTVAIGRTLLLSSYSVHGWELWRTDGSESGTGILRDIAPGHDMFGQPRSSNPQFVGIVNGKALYAANDRRHGNEPWITDGTFDGTVMLANVVAEATIRGRVRDAGTGAAVAGAKVELQCRYWPDPCGVQEVDANGDFAFDTLEAGGYRLKASSTAHVAQTWSAHECPDCAIDEAEPIEVATGETKESNFALRRAGTVRGRVTEPHGAPVAGLRVFAAAEPGAPPTAVAVTNTDGTYVLGGLPPESSWLVYTDGSSGWSSVTHSRLQPAPGETVSGIDFIVRRWGKVRVRLLDGITREPANQWMQIDIFRDDQPFDPAQPWKTVHANDSVELELPDGRYRFLARRRWERELYQNTWYPNIGCDPCTSPAGQPLAPVPGQTIDAAIYLESTHGYISGRALDALTGEPLAGVWINGIIQTNADGTYLLRVQPGMHRMTAHATRTHTTTIYDPGGGILCPSWCPEIDGESVRVRSKEITSGIDFRMHRYGIVRIRVLDAVTHRPIPFARVWLNGSRATFAEPAGEYTDTNGTLVVGEMLAAELEVRISDLGWTETELRGETAFDRETVLNVRLQPACAVKAVVTRAEFPAEGGIGELLIDAPCHLWIRPNAPWVWPGASGNFESNRVSFEVKPNDSPVPRTATFTFPGTSVTIQQAGRR